MQKFKEMVFHSKYKRFLLYLLFFIIFMCMISFSYAFFIYSDVQEGTYWDATYDGVTLWVSRYCASSKREWDIDVYAVGGGYIGNYNATNSCPGFTWNVSGSTANYGWA